MLVPGAPWKSSIQSINRVMLLHVFSLHSHNDFVAILDLPEGEHQYKFFVDGQWVHDPSEVMLQALSLQILSSSGKLDRM